MGWSAVETFWRKHMIRLQYLIGPTLLVFLVLRGIVSTAAWWALLKGLVVNHSFVVITGSVPAANGERGFWPVISARPVMTYFMDFVERSFAMVVLKGQRKDN